MTNEQIINKEWEKEFDKEVPGYSMNEYNPGEEPLIRPIMCQREDAKQFIATQLKKERQNIERDLLVIATKGGLEGLKTIVVDYFK